MNKLYIAAQTCSLAAQLVANELGLTPELRGERGGINGGSLL
jgi:hypothetical protein